MSNDLSMSSGSPVDETDTLECPVVMIYRILLGKLPCKDANWRTQEWGNHLHKDCVISSIVCDTVLQDSESPS
jgi:hypothetical protein